MAIVSPFLGFIICEAQTEARESNIIGMTNGRVELDACLQDVNVVNRNGRYYAENELFPKLKDERLIELMEANSLFGEASHPISPDLTRQSTIDQRNASHLIKKLWTDKNKVMGRLRAAATRVGDDYQRLILDGMKSAYSLRALGGIQKTAKGNEVKNIKIITWDWVVYPSHRTAYMTNLVDENNISGKVNESGILLESPGLIIPISNDNVVDYIKSKSENIKSIIEDFEFMYDECYYDKSKGMVILKEKDSMDKIYINTESFIQNEILDYCHGIK